MPLTQTQSNESANTGANAKTALANGGFLDWYNGAQPATADSPIGASTLLASLALSNPAFNAAVGGVATAKSIAPATGLATLTAQWFRVWKSDHTSPLWDGSIGTSGCNLNMTDPNIVTGQPVSCSLFQYTDDKS